MRVLLDTNIISYKMKQKAEFMEPIRREFARVPASAEFVISAVTVQEFGVWALFEGNWDEVRADLFDTFRSLLPYDRASAEAALLFEAAARPGFPTRPKLVREDAIDRWNHDTAIVGTAHAHRVDRIITAERKWHAFRPHFSGEIVIVEAEKA